MYSIDLIFVSIVFKSTSQWLSTLKIYCDGDHLNTETHSCLCPCLVLLMFSFPPRDTLPSPALSWKYSYCFSDLCSSIDNDIILGTNLHWLDQWKRGAKVEENESGPVEKVFPLISTTFKFFNLIIIWSSSWNIFNIWHSINWRCEIC